MKTFRVDRACDPVKLHEELAALGIPVVTVRSERAGFGQPAMCAVVVVDDTAADVTVNAVIAAHAVILVPITKPIGFDQLVSLAEMEKA